MKIEMQMQMLAYLVLQKCKVNYMNLILFQKHFLKMFFQVIKEWIEKGNIKNLVGLDLDRNENISEGALTNLVKLQGPMLRGLGLSNMPHITEHFWNAMLPMLKNSRYVRSFHFVKSFFFILCF